MGAVTEALAQATAMRTHVVPLPWDTEFFSVPIGRITTSVLDAAMGTAVLDEARRRGLRCLYFEADPTDLVTVMTAERHGFHLVNVRVVLEHPFVNRPAAATRYPAPSELLINAAVESDLPRLEDIATEVSRFSRFNFDSRFNSGEHERLYRAWIRNAMAGSADAVFVARRARGRGAGAGGGHRAEPL